MNERLLQFIWQARYLQQGPLYTTQGELLEVLYPGLWNKHQGPDFSAARIKIGNTLWAGNVELHLRASDWLRHQHQTDPNFNNIILHVVWENDTEILDPYGLAYPSICIQPYVSSMLLNRYQKMMKNQENISLPCKHYLPAMDELHWHAWNERLIAERLEKKKQRIMQLLTASKQHWETVFWWMLANNFGLKVNALLFESVAKTISLNLLAKHKNQLLQIEALLLGQANLLEGDFEESYPIMLQKEYRFLQKKYRLPKQLLQPAFLRMRPAAFPSIRLAQLAMLVHQSAYLFATIKEASSLITVRKLFQVQANDYWLYHYQFDEPTVYSIKNLGNQMIDIILINTVVPLLFTYGKLHQQENLSEKAIDWLQEITREQNSIVNSWMKNGIACKSALDSQALLELSQSYCKEKRCLECAVGAHILKQAN